MELISELTDSRNHLLPTEPQEHKYRELDKVIEQLKGDKSELIKVLHSAQTIFGYLPPEVQAYVALQMDIPVSEVNGVVTFYTIFITEPQGKYSVNVCLGTACYVKGAGEILDQLREELQLGAQGTSPDNLFTVRSTRCIGACGMAPVLSVDEEIHGRLDAGQISDILKKYRKQDEDTEDD